MNETTDSTETAASKLKVGPGIFELPYKIGTKFLFGDYWVVAVGEYSYIAAMYILPEKWDLMSMGTKLWFFVMHCMSALHDTIKQTCFTGNATVVTDPVGAGAY